MHERGLHELSITQPAFSISLLAEHAAPAHAAPLAAHAAPVTRPAAIIESTQEVMTGYAITTPIIGTFYRASSPETPMFVDIGDMVEAGQTVGIVEAMKVYNEITSDIAGIVIAIPAQNGQLVQVDEPLVILQPMN